MSERMIEMQRANLGLPPAGSSPATPAMGQSSTPRGGAQNNSSSQPAVRLTPQEAAAQEVQSEDAQIQRFLHRLQRRDDSHPTEDTVSGPTVPTALSRRMLQRQGVGYLDDTVAAAVSASADRFLATVLQQAVACRDQRLKGAEMAREAARHRKRHMQHYNADSDDRKRRKEESGAAREEAQQRAIAAGDALKKGGQNKDGSDDKRKKKKKKDDAKPAATNGAKGSAMDSKIEDDEASYDSIDEEEDYYQRRISAVKVTRQNREEDDDDTMLLRDLVRPLEAWDFHLAGKEALDAHETGSGDDHDGSDMAFEKMNGSTSQTDDANDDGLTLGGMADDGEEGGKEDGDQDEGRVSPSPVPKS